MVPSSLVNRTERISPFYHSLRNLRSDAVFRLIYQYGYKFEACKEQEMRCSSKLASYHYPKLPAFDFLSSRAQSDKGAPLHDDRGKGRGEAGLGGGRLQTGILSHA